jgi:hypothetical protein
MNDYEEACDIIMSQQRLITALTHTLNELYDVGYEIYSHFDLDANFDGVLDTRLRLALKQADELLEGN